MSNYGIPYMGSKAKIVESIALNFPPAENFYDLFGGGFSMSHYMYEKRRNKYKNFHYNEIKADVVDLVKRAINGEFNYKVFKPEWISRERFFKDKDNDAYIRCIWSFGNNQSCYLFGPENEKYKRSLHQAIVFDEFDDIAIKYLGIKQWPKEAKTIYQRRIYSRQIFTFNKSRLDLQRLQHLEQFERLQHLERLQRMEQFERLQHLERLQRLQKLEPVERLTFSSLDYRLVDIKENSVVYCDIPYKGTADYIDAFNHKEFYDWAMTRNFPVFVSEYDIPDNRFKLVYQITKRSLLSSDKSVGNKQEKLYWNGK